MTRDEELFGDKFCKCGKPSNHQIILHGGTIRRYLCCACYVAEGNPPADWHPECMKAYNERPWTRDEELLNGPSTARY